MRNYPVILVPSREQWFEQVRKSWTAPNSCQVQPQAWFPVLNYGSNRFGRVEQPWTHEKLSYDPCSLWSSEIRRGSVELNNPELMRNYPMFLVRKDWTTCQVLPQVWFPGWAMVRTGSEELNHPKLRRNCPTILVPSRAQRFQQVWKSWTTPNSCQVPPQAWLPVLNCSPLSLCSARVQRGLIDLNHPELKWNYPIVLCPFVAHEFEEVQ